MQQATGWQGPLASWVRVRHTRMELDMWCEANPGLPIGWFSTGRALVWAHIEAYEEHYLRHCRMLPNLDYLIELYLLLSLQPFTPPPSPDSAPVPRVIPRLGAGFTF